MHGWGLFFLSLILLVTSIICGWVSWRQYKAIKQGSTPPSLKSWRTYVPLLKAQGSSSNYPAPRHAGPLEWFRDLFSRLTNKRTARGAYEEAGSDTEFGTNGRRRGRGVEDDAWDVRVGNEDPYASGPGYAGYEEQELGLASTSGLHNEPYAGGSGSAGDYLGPKGGYSEVDERGRPSSAKNLDPFADQNEAPSLRSVSPRPEADSSGRGHTKGSQSLDTQGSGDGGSSPTSTRKSIFREGI